MKAFILGLIMVGSAHASKVTCLSENQRWSANFNLDHHTLTHLEIKRDGAVVSSHQKLEGDSIRFLGVRYYEFSMGGAKYFNIERRKNAKTFPANFLLTNNPFVFEKHVDCTME
jgi:hypothetical protein